MLLLHVENAKSPYRGRRDTPLPPLGGGGGVTYDFDGTCLIEYAIKTERKA